MILIDSPSMNTSPTHTVQEIASIKKMPKHGSYSITTHKQILTMKAYDEWNIETVISCCRSFKIKANKLKHKNWACLVDLSEWELGPPEILHEIKKLNVWSEKNNQTFEAVVIKNALQRQLLEITHMAFNNIQAKFFDNHHDALSWLATSQRAS